MVYDLDDEGRRGALAVVEALEAGGIDAQAYELPAELGNAGTLTTSTGVRARIYVRHSSDFPS